MSGEQEMAARMHASARVRRLQMEQRNRIRALEARVDCGEEPCSMPYQSSDGWCRKHLLAKWDDSYVKSLELKREQDRESSDLAADGATDEHCDLGVTAPLGDEPFYASPWCYTHNRDASFCITKLESHVKDLEAELAAALKPTVGLCGNEDCFQWFYLVLELGMGCPYCGSTDFQRAAGRESGRSG